MMRINLLFLPKQQHIFAWTLDLLLFLIICITNESTFLSLRTTTCSNQQHVNFCPTTSNQLLFMMKKQETISNLEAVENKIVQSRDEVCWCDGEVVGATGRIGSFLLGTNVYFKPVPRHDDDARPGTFSSANSPIFASVPATQVPSGTIYNMNITFYIVHVFVSLVIISFFFIHSFSLFVLCRYFISD